MSDRICPSCRAPLSATAEGTCPHCGQPLGAESRATEAPAMAPGEPVPVRSEPAEGQAPAPPPPPVSPPPPTPGAVLSDGQYRCPHCGEALYHGERTCWNCGRRVDETAGAEEQWPMTVPVTAQPESPPQPAVLAWEPTPPPESAHAPIEAGAMSAAWWSLGLGLAALLTCGGLSILAPIGLWLGIKATRGGAGPVGVVGLVMGAVGTFVLFVLLATLGVILISVAVTGGEGTREVIGPVAHAVITARSAVRCL